MSVEVEGADQLARLAKALKEAGNKDLQRELSKALNRAMKPLKADIKQSALDNLPKRGGYAAAIAASRLATRRPNNAKGTGLRIIGRNKYSLYHADQGVIRHGDGKDQPITPGWWTKPTEAIAPDVRREV